MGHVHVPGVMRYHEALGDVTADRDETGTVKDCNRLQQTAIDCNALQQTAAHCNALQQRGIWPVTGGDVAPALVPPPRYTLQHFNTLQHTATRCNALHRTATQCK